MRTSLPLSRRRFLTGVGGTCLALPWLEAFSQKANAAAPLGPPKRLVVLAYPMGFVRAHWQPAQTGSTFTLPHIVAPLEPFKDRLLLLSNLDNAVCQLNSKHAFGHPGKKESVLTGTLMRTAFTNNQENRIDNVIADGGSADGGPNNESICHFIGRAIGGKRPMKSIDLGVSGDNNNIGVLRSSFFFEAATTPVSIQCNPARAFHGLFSQTPTDPGASAAQRKALLRKKSVLDLVRKSYLDLKAGLNRADQQRLEDHAQKVRQIEIDVQTMSACSAPKGNYGTPAADAPYAPFQTLSMLDRSKLMVPLLTQGLGCDLAPVARLEYFDQQNPKFGVASVDDALKAWNAQKKDWHAMVHGDNSPIDNVSTRGTPAASFLLDGYRFFYEQMAAVLTGLKNISEGVDGRTALDNSLVLICSDFGDGNGHSANKLGFALAGNLNGAKTHFHFNGQGANGDFYTASKYNSSHLLHSLLQCFEVKDSKGAPVTQFGLQGFSAGAGTLPVFG
jgi:Protein of unknown function (DUF1552)